MNPEILQTFQVEDLEAAPAGERATGARRPRRYGAVVTGSKFIFPRFARARRLPRFAT